MFMHVHVQKDLVSSPVNLSNNNFSQVPNNYNCIGRENFFSFRCFGDKEVDQDSLLTPKAEVEIMASLNKLTKVNFLTSQTPRSLFGVQLNEAGKIPSLSFYPDLNQQEKTLIQISFLGIVTLGLFIPIIDPLQIISLPEIAIVSCLSCFLP